ncbi:hypothetical protein HYV88_04850 [Candidatus Woesearchaeota archaeon]|nr:hypothetical protein [Candidatus Woesearchaeota archaeon]
MENKFDEILSKVGLTKQEVRTYLVLLKLQESQTGELCKETNIASSNIYKILDSLIKKGLVSYRVQNNIKIFMPSPPEALNELFLEKQRRLEEERKEINEVIDNLKKKEINEEPYSKYKYYEGLIGIKSMWHEINSLLTRDSEEKIYGGKKEAYERLIGFYDEHHKIRNKLNAKAKILLPLEDKELAKKRKNKNTQVAFYELKNLAEWGIVDNMVYIQYYTSKIPRAFLIKDKIFADTFKEVFDNVWKTAKK